VFPIHFLIHWSFDHAQLSPVSAPSNSLKIVAERPPPLPAAILSRAFLLLSLLLLYCFNLTTIYSCSPTQLLYINFWRNRSAELTQYSIGVGLVIVL
jgi:hypothetical protein